MVCNTDVSIAIKNRIGQYQVDKFSLFKFNNINGTLPFSDYKLSNERQISFKINCPICGGFHSYSYHIHDFIKREMVIGGCDITGKPVFFIGSENKIGRVIDKYNEVNKKIYAMI